MNGDAERAGVQGLGHAVSAAASWAVGGMCGVRELLVLKLSKNDREDGESMPLILRPEHRNMSEHLDGIYA